MRRDYGCCGGGDDDGSVWIDVGLINVSCAAMAREEVNC